MLFGETGRINFFDELHIMEDLDDEGKKEHIKKLFDKDPLAYFDFKEWCIRLSKLPDFFGTRDNPIPIDESKL